MISKAEFRRRVVENTAHFSASYTTSVDAAAYHLYDALRGETRPMMLLDKVYDIFAAVSIGALAVTARDGADAMMQMSGSIIPIELKFVKIESSSYLVGPRGGIYKGGRASRTPLNQSMQAQYTINNEAHLSTKNRYTVMVVYDQTTGMFVEARGILGSTALEKLSSQRTSRRMFYWDTFLEHGRRIPLVVPSLGYDGLVKLIEENNR
jgi:hypothetical protein